MSFVYFEPYQNNLNRWGGRFLRSVRPSIKAQGHQQESTTLLFI